MNANIMKTHFFHKMMHELKGQTSSFAKIEGPLTCLLYGWIANFFLNNVDIYTTNFIIQFLEYTVCFVKVVICEVFMGYPYTVFLNIATSKRIIKRIHTDFTKSLAA